MAVELQDNSALIWGFRLHPEGMVEPISWTQLDNAVATDDGFLWLHFNLLDPRSRTWLERSPAVPAEAVHTLLGTDRHMCLKPLGGGMIGVVGDLHHDLDTDPSAVGTLRLYLDQRCLVSGRRTPLRAIDNLRRNVAGGARMPRPACLLVSLLNQAAETQGIVLTDLADALDNIEEKLLSDRFSSEAGELGRVRRMAAQLRRTLVPQRQALADAMLDLPDWLDPADASGLTRAAERLASICHDLDLLQERAMLLQGEVSGRLAETTNRNLYLLSIVTTIFLPMTLITGVFGMNVGGLPGLGVDNGFLWTMVGMAATGGVTLGLLYWRRLF